MSNNGEVERFVKDPSQLVELCRDVVEQLDVSSEGSAVAEQEAQLRAIAKAVEQLERSSVPVPETLRAEKTRLAAALAVHADAKQALAQLADEFEDILKDLRDRLGQNANTTGPRPRTTRTRSPKTPQRVLRQHIVQALRTLGGRARVSDVIAQMAVQLEGQLLEGDLVWRESANEPAWQNNAKWERFQMTQEGVLKRDSPRGIWELEEGQP
jgi:hypothetical protein